MINLCLVVIATQFSETKKREMERMKLERARFQSTSTLGSGSVNEQVSCYAEIIKYITHLCKRAKRKIYSRYRMYKRRHKSDRPRQLSLKRQRRKRHYDNPPMILTSTGTGVMSPSGTQPPGGLTVLNKLVTPTPQIVTTPDTVDNSETRQSCNIKQTTTTSDADSNNMRPALLKIPSNTNGESSVNELAPPSPSSGSGYTPRRRRSSVMFSDVVLLHGHSGETATRNVCLSEKTTQTEPDDPLDPSLFREPLPSIQAAPRSRSSPRGTAHSPLVYEGGGKGALTCGELLALSGALSAALPTHLGIDSRSVHTLYSSLAKGVKHFSAPTLFFAADQAPAAPNYYSTSESETSDSDYTDDESSEDDETKNSGVRRCCHWISGKVSKLVEHRYFQRSILIAILINTLSMGVEYHNQVTKYISYSLTFYKIRCYSYHDKNLMFLC